ncbi:hypothetical protein [Arthrobacter flavus]|uniref:Uncharacterized protein n=1 Tax=Arthrobacter flavus TaxID=95172 RepID=A0ABW4Q9E7_9MICC
MRKFSSRRLALAGGIAAILAIVLYGGATIASAIEYNMTEAAGLPIDGPPTVILIVGTIGMILGLIALVLLISALVVYQMAGRKTPPLVRWPR